MALTDKGNMFGLMEFYFQAKEKGIHPVLGTEFYIGKPVSNVSSSVLQKLEVSSFVLLAQNQEGYYNLCQLQSLAHQKNYDKREEYPLLSEENLFKHRAGLFALSGSLQGAIALALLEKGKDAAFSTFQTLKSIYGKNLYLELQRPNKVKAWNKVNAFLMELSREHDTPLVVANEVFLIHEKQRLLQKVLHCVEANIILGDVDEEKLSPTDAYFKSSEQMLLLFQDLPEACTQTLNIAEACQVDFTLEDSKGRKIYHLPQVSFKDKRSSKDHLRELSFMGLEKRLQEKKKRKERDEKERDKEIGKEIKKAREVKAVKETKAITIDKHRYNERLEKELQVITEMEFSDYFLIVQDFICWAKNQRIPVGPGRGSGVGSLVSYCLGITELDPLEFNLFFERFLNQERISMPDFDIDFCPEGRDRVLEYVTQKYGAEKVAQIITYGKFQARASLRDVGRAMGMALNEVDALAKLIPEKPGTTLKEALKAEPRLKEEMEKEAGVNELMQLALELEGYVRHQGVHAAGVVISQKPLIHYTPLCRGKYGEVVSQYDMKSLEKIGLVKFDFLGLKTLTHLHLSLKFIEETHQKKIPLDSIPLDDPNIYKLMCSGKTAGIFQFEGSGMSNAITQIQPNSLEDITAINALYRPGPMEMIPEFANRKKGKVRIKYVLPELEPILRETYGIMIYQEQVMRIAVEIAGYSAGEADILRRAMGKKQKEEMASQKRRFIRGVVKNGHSKQKAEELFHLMDKFAEYGFNKAHAAAYCVIAAQTAWIKHYYPTEFFAALLSLEMNNTDKIIHYVNDARANGITIHPPHVNKSNYIFSIKNNHIYFGLGAIKGVGKPVVEAIIEARKKYSPKEGFKSLKDFFTEIDVTVSKMSKKTLESLIYAGAFDYFGEHRAQLIKNYNRYMQYALRKQLDHRIGQMNLLSFEDEIKTLGAKPWNVLEKLAYEKQVLGFYLTDHPLKLYEKACQYWSNTSISSLQKVQNTSSIKNQKFKILCIVSKIRERVTKKEQRMAFVSLEDRTGAMEVLVFPSAFAEVESKLKSGLPLLTIVQFSNRFDDLKLVLNQAYTIDTYLNNAKEIIFNLDCFEEKNCVHRLHTLLKNYKGNVRTYLQIRSKKSKNTKPWQMEIEGTKISGQFFENLYKEFGRSDFVQIF